MAHECINCGSECYCSGDIDDVVVSLTPSRCRGCENCNDVDEYDDDEYDDDEYDDDSPSMEHHCPHCGAEYDEIDYEFQICHLCGQHACALTPD